MIKSKEFEYNLSSTWSEYNCQISEQIDDFFKKNRNFKFLGISYTVTTRTIGFIYYAILIYEDNNQK